MPVFSIDMKTTSYNWKQQYLKHYRTKDVMEALVQTSDSCVV